MDDYTLEDFSGEEADALTKELQEVLAKYDGEMGVSSQINLMKRVPTGVPSPLTQEDLQDESSTNSTTEEGS